MGRKQERKRGREYNAANNQKPNHDIDSFECLLDVFPHVSVDCDFCEELPRDREVEDGSDADGAEETDKARVEDVLDLVDPFVHCDNGGQAPDEQDQNSQEYEPVDRDDLVVSEPVPRRDGAEP